MRAHVRRRSARTGQSALKYSLSCIRQVRRMYSETQLKVRNAIREFAQSTLLPDAAERDRKKQFPRSAIHKLGELGYMGMLVPRDAGGAGLDYVSYALAISELAAGDGAFSTIVSVHNSLICSPIYRYGTAAQKTQFLPPLVQGKHLGAFCLTESGAGSDASAITTTARRDNDDYILNGRKRFITSGQNADIAIVFAITAPEASSRRASAFIVPTATPGYSVVRAEDTFGQCSSDHCEIAFDNCRIPATQRLGEEGDGMRIALGNLAVGRIGVAAQSFGMARAACDLALAHAKDRRTFGKPIIDHQAIAFTLADMKTALQASELMIWRAATSRDSDEGSYLIDASMAKLFASEAAETIASSAIQILGGYGYLREYDVERIYRDVRACRIYEGASEIQRLVISRELKKTSKSDLSCG